MVFGGMKWRTKAELELDNIERELKEAKERLAAKEKQILHRVFIRDAGLQEMQKAKREHRELTIKVRKLSKKLADKEVK